MTRVDKELAQVPRSQVERLAYIEARLYVLGELQRQDVVQRFSVASVQIFHPKITYQAVTDYHMKGPRIEVSCRAAIAGYMLRPWGVNCSLDSFRNPEEYHLALQNIESLASAESSDLAPGFKRKKGLP